MPDKSKPDWSKKFAQWGRVVVGGRMGLVAWGISGASAAAVIMWGLSTVAIPLIMLKTASWGIWGFGVFRESKSQLEAGKKPPSAPLPPKDPLS
jgi:hypothetical protein